MTTTVAVVDAKTTTGDRNDETTNPRKRSFQEPGDDQKGESGSGDQQQGQQTTPKLSSSARRRNRKKRQKTKTSQQQAQSQSQSQAQAGTTTTTTTTTTSVNSEKQKQKQKPLAGLVLSVSTMKDKVKAKKQKNSSDEAENDKGDGNGNDNVTPSMLSYNEVCRSCKDLGAEVIDLVCKRVSVVICTEAAVRQATQRVRKAIKRNKPLVSVEWLEECRKQNRRVEFEDYRLDKKAEGVVQNREDKLRNSSSKSSGAANGDSGDDGLEGVPDSAWSEPQELGCCCVCHENGTTADCPWCVDCNV